VGVQYSLARKLLWGRLKKECFIGGNEKYEVASTSFPGEGNHEKSFEGRSW